MSKKDAEKWAEEILNSDKAKYAIDKFNNVFLETVLTGESIFIKDGIPYSESEFYSKFGDLKFVDSVSVSEKLSAEEIVERFSNKLNEDQINELKKFSNNE